LDIYQTEDEQVEALKKWWKENGNSAIFGVVLGLMAIFGWREWNDYKAEQAAAASQLYQEMTIAVRDNQTDVASESAEKIVSSYDSTGYAVFAKLGLAKIAVTSGELDQALSNLQWALDNTDQETLRHIITLRIVEILITQSKLSEAESLLAKNRNRGDFNSSYVELEGDIQRLQGNTNAAAESYQRAFDLAQESGLDTTLLDMKIDDLGRSQEL
jgi:predicted negative regulator of RcsB-dependent stress response